jgi:hypothetical protein
MPIQFAQGLLTKTVPSIRVYNSIDQTILTATDTVLTWDSEVFKSVASMHNNAVNNSRIVVPETGKYLLTVVVCFAPNGTGLRQLSYRVNGGGFPQFLVWTPALSGTVETFVDQTTVVSMNANDYLEVTATQTSGGNLAIQNRYWASLVNSYVPTLTLTKIG